jgi:hypothetical protein
MTVAAGVQVLLDEMGNDLGVGLSGEAVALGDELLLQRKVVLDDAVVDDDDLAGAVAVRMRVFFGGAAVSGPASVADAVGAVEWLEADGLFQVSQLAFCPADLQALAVAGDGDAGRVVAAVFEPAQTVDDDGNDASCLRNQRFHTWQNPAGRPD